MENPINWAQWFAVALPVSAISILLIWLLLLMSYRPARSPDGEGDIEIKPIRPTRDKFTLKQYWVCFICLGTVVLWICEHALEDYVGDMGIIAIIPIVAFFSTGVLKKVCPNVLFVLEVSSSSFQDDFDQFLWTVVFLAMGGIALGKGVTSSGLLDVMDEAIHHMVEGLSSYTVVLTLSCIILVNILVVSERQWLTPFQVISTFISHTIASVLLVPIASQVGSQMEGHPQNLMIFLTALICSAGMGMPVSGFPNQTA